MSTKVLSLMVVALSLHSFSAAQRSQSPLTDRDVIQMLESGKTEAAIVATIRSSRTDFDLSPRGCSLLVAAHVNRTILNAMAAPGQPACASTSDASKGQTSGTLLGNGNTTLLGDGSVHAPSGAKSGAGSPGANVAQATTAVSDYRQPPGANVAQATAAGSDYRQPSGTRESSGPSGTTGSKNPGWPGRSADGARPALPAAFTGGLKVVAGKKVSHALATNSSIIAVLRQQKEEGTLPPGHTLGSGSMPPNLAERSSTKLSTVQAPYLLSNLLSTQENAQCQQREAQSLDPQILRIAGKPNGQGVVYSQDPQANPYAIVGCGFGNTKGRVSIIWVKFAQGMPLTIQSWNDHQIVASFPPMSFPDQDKAVLMVTTQNQKNAWSLDGSFYAQRATIQLPSIQLNQTSLYQAGSPYFLSPVSNYYGLNGTVAVMRQGMSGPVAGQDQFTLQLRNGFVLESTQTDLLVSNMSANVTSNPASVNGNTITVTYPVMSYSSGSATSYYSIYGLKIWVTGPIGVTP